MSVELRLDLSKVWSMEELRGHKVQVDDYAQFYGEGQIIFRGPCRIDAGVIVILSRGQTIDLGPYTHIGHGSQVHGPLTMGFNATLSGGVLIYANSDDYGGDYLIGPTAPRSMRSGASSPVRLYDNAHIAAGSVVLPGVELLPGAVLGAASLAPMDTTLDAWTVYGGVPARLLGTRQRGAAVFQEALEA